MGPQYIPNCIVSMTGSLSMYCLVEKNTILLGLPAPEPMIYSILTRVQIYLFTYLFSSFYKNEIHLFDCHVSGIQEII